MIAGLQQEKAIAIDRPVWHFVSGWLVVFVLIYFAVESSFSFATGAVNSALGAQGVSETSGNGLLETLTRVVFLLLIAYLVFPHLRQILRTFGELKFFAAVTLLPLLSVLWSSGRDLSAKYGLYFILSMLLAVYLAERLSPEHQMQALWVLAMLTVIASIAAAVFFPAFGIDHRTGRGNEWEGIFPGKNVCAMMLFFLLMPTLLVPAKNLLPRIAKVCTVLLLLLVIGMTRSVTGEIVTASYLVFVAAIKLLGNFKRRDRLVLGILFVIVAVTVLGVAWANLDNVAAFFGRDPTFSGRTQIWAAVMHSISKRPLLGYGYRAFWQGMNGESANVIIATGWKMGYAHNGFLELWVELGAVGLGLFFLTFFKACRDAITCFRVGRPAYIDWYVGVLAYTIIYNVDEATLMYAFNLTWILYVIACIGLHYSAKQTRQLRARQAEIESTLVHAVHA